MMRSAPGIGKVMGPLWISLFAGQQGRSQDPPALGFAPQYRSGSSVKRTDYSSGFGNSEVRRVMHQAALSVKTRITRITGWEYYEKKRAEGK